MRSKVASDTHHGSTEGLRRTAKDFYYVYKIGSIPAFNFDRKSRKNLFGTP